MPADMCFTRWFCLGPSVYMPFIPISSMADEFYRAYTTVPSVDRLDTESAYGLSK